MTFRASSEIPMIGLSKAKAEAWRVRNYAQQWGGKFNATGATSSDVMQVARRLSQFADSLEDIKDTPGIGQYAKDQENDQSYDVAVEFNALIAAINDTWGTMKGTFPVDGDGYLLAKKFDVGANVVDRFFTPAMLSTVIAKLQLIVSQVS